MKLSKMQLNRVENALYRERTAKVEAIRLLKVPSVNKRERGIKWAKRSPKAFAEACEELYRGGSFAYIKEVYDDCPDAIKAVEYEKKIKAANKAAIAKAELKLNAECSRIMDELYLNGADDAMKAIQEFKKFKV